MVERIQTAKPSDFVEKIFVAAPGTEIMMDEDAPRATERRLRNLQHETVSYGRILLVPQPSLTNPNDPLRWSSFKKWTVLLNGVAYAFNGAVTGPMMAGGMLQLAAFYDVSLAMVSYANGATLICQGFGNLFWMPLAIKYGRRPVYRTSNILMGLACIWLAIAAEKSYIPFIAGRAFLGLFQAPIEAIVPSTVTDIFHLHERGEKISIYGLGVLGGNEIGPLVSAYIIQALSVRWAFFIIAASIGVNMMTLIFFMPETKFTGPRPAIAVAGDDETTTTSPPDKPQSEHREEIGGCSSDASHVIAEKTYRESLAFCSGVDHSVSLKRAFLRPFILTAYPIVLWSSLIYGLALGWNVILGVLVAQLFAPPPYNFASGAQGLVFLSPLLGSLAGTYLCGPLADRIATWATQQNHGIREPEMRLPACAIAAVLTFVGALVAALAYEAGTHWVGPVGGLGVLAAGAQMGATLAMSYSLDCHKELSGELMVTISCLKSLIAWVWTWVVNEWLVADGVVVVFMTVAAVNVAVYLTSIVFYFKDARLLLNTPYLQHEAGYAINAEGMHHIAASTYMPLCTGPMIDWWFGWIHNTAQYQLWHPHDHVFSDWEGPRDNNSTYIGGHHLVHEYIGGNLAKLKISFRDPGEYFGDSWREDFAAKGYATAVCGRVGNWTPETGEVLYTGHLVHLVKEERIGCRMRSHFWLGDVEGVVDPAKRAAGVPGFLPRGLCQHATEEMAVLASILPELYEKYSRK
ncbi:hypothetical protein VE03_10868 [Pseudogymnoascus sp. 23342-1-I1]|nr:hypothetical protein VE03_10868 [Pseudogymnoascus sp. 23342-1-I1]